MGVFTHTSDLKEIYMSIFEDEEGLVEFLTERGWYPEDLENVSDFGERASDGMLGDLDEWFEGGEQL